MIRVLGYGWRTCRWATSGAVAAVVLSAGFGVALVFLIGRVVGVLPSVLAGDDQIGRLVWLLVALLLVLVGNAVSPVLVEVATNRLGFRVRERLATDLATMLLTPKRVSHLDDPEVADQRRRAFAHDGQAIESGVRNAPGMLGDRLALFGALGLVGWFLSWWAALILALAGLGRARWMAYWFVVEDEVWTGQAERHRRADYLFAAGTGPARAEASLFGLRDWLVRRYAEEWDAAVGAYRLPRRRIWTANAAVLGGCLVVHLVAIWYATRAASTEAIGVDALATVVPAVIAAGTTGSGGDGMVLRALPALQALRTLPSTIEYATGASSAADAGRKRPLPARRMALADPKASEPVLSETESSEPAPPEGVRFERVTFSYPGSTMPVLRDLDLRIDSGETVALVGVNGAGKSTIVRLLTGMLRPSDGRVTAGGQDLAALDDEQLGRWQQGFAIVDQTFLRLPLTRDQNIFLGKGNMPADDETAVGSELPHRADTVLDPAFTGGVEPSGGEWQRIALERARMALARGAERIVLDEPAAALDVRAEAALVDRYLRLAAGRTVLVISHRLSVVRGADRICVLADGRIVEQGTHSELLRRDGRYARMFRLQAERLVGNEDEPGSAL